MARHGTTLVHTPRRTAWTWLRANFNLTPRIIGGWNDLTLRLAPPDGALEEFVRRHLEVRAGQVPLLWEAFLQWVRVSGRHEVSVCQPSLAVDELWQQLAENRQGWRLLPQQVQDMHRLEVRGHSLRRDLVDTYRQAYWDEYAGGLPLLAHPNRGCRSWGLKPPVSSRLRAM